MGFPFPFISVILPSVYISNILFMIRKFISEGQAIKALHQDQAVTKHMRGNNTMQPRIQSPQATSQAVSSEYRSHLRPTGRVT